MKKPLSMRFMMGGHKLEGLEMILASPRQPGVHIVECSIMHYQVGLDQKGA